MVYCLEEGEPLYLLLRSVSDGYWGLPKGKVDPGETDEQAARRELAEETGITDFEPRDGFGRTITYSFSRCGEEIHKTVRYFLTRVGSREVEISPEHCESGWLTMRKAQERIPFANLRQVLQAADRFIAGA